MKKIIIILVTLVVIVFVVVFSSFHQESNKEPNLAGFYQSDGDGGHIVQISINSHDKTFEQYISSRKVDEGCFEKNEDGSYLLSGEGNEFTVSLLRDDSFELFLPKINDNKPILLKQVLEDKYSNTTIGQIYDDVEEYKKLLQ